MFNRVHVLFSEITRFAATACLSHSYYKNNYVTWTPGILSRHLANGCVLKCNCIGLMVFRNLSCLGIIICYINTI